MSTLKTKKLFTKILTKALYDGDIDTGLVTTTSAVTIDAGEGTTIKIPVYTDDHPQDKWRAIGIVGFTATSVSGAALKDICVSRTTFLTESDVFKAYATVKNTSTKTATFSYSIRVLYIKRFS